MKYLHPKQVRYLYQQIIQQSGGTIGLRDEGLLEAAVYRPQASFGGQDLYPDLFSKAAALGHSIISNHPFVDGNKRTALTTLEYFLHLNGLELIATQREKVDFTLWAENEKPKLGEIADWIKKHTR